MTHQDPKPKTSREELLLFIDEILENAWLNISRATPLEISQFITPLLERIKEEGRREGVEEAKKKFYEVLNNTDLSWAKHRINPPYQGGFVRVIGGDPYLLVIDEFKLADAFENSLKSKK